MNVHTAIYPDMPLSAASVAKANICHVIHGELFPALSVVLCLVVVNRMYRFCPTECYRSLSDILVLLFLAL